jgi:hypothetical protein
MDLSNAHNLNRPPPPAGALRYGIRVRLPTRDPLRHLLAGDWEKTHWYATAAERDTALAEMAARHPWSRIGDRPNLVFDAIDR